MSHQSLWSETSSVPASLNLERDGSADVCVVGAGIAGLSVAYHLLREGRSVVVLNDGPVGAGQTHLTSAHLSNALDDRYYVLERKKYQAQSQSSGTTQST